MLGCIQATEVLKVLLNRPSSDCLAGRVLVYDALRMTFREIPLVKGAAECAAAEKSLEEEPLPPDAHTSLTATECADKLRGGLGALRPGCAVAAGSGNLPAALRRRALSA